MTREQRYKAALEKKLYSFFNTFFTDPNDYKEIAAWLRSFYQQALEEPECTCPCHVDGDDAAYTGCRCSKPTQECECQCHVARRTDKFIPQCPWCFEHKCEEKQPTQVYGIDREKLQKTVDNYPRKEVKIILALQTILDCLIPLDEKE